MAGTIFRRPSTSSGRPARCRDAIRNIWSDRPIGVLVSIGTGLEEALQLNDTSKAVPGVVQALLRNTSPAHAFKLAVAEYAVKCITSCELTHREVTEHCEREILEGNYFRLNEKK